MDISRRNLLIAGIAAALAPAAMAAAREPEAAPVPDCVPPGRGPLPYTFRVIDGADRNISHLFDIRGPLVIHHREDSQIAIFLAVKLGVEYPYGAMMEIETQGVRLAQTLWRGWAPATKLNGGRFNPVIGIWGRVEDVPGRGPALILYNTQSAESIAWAEKKWREYANSSMCSTSEAGIAASNPYDRLYPGPAKLEDVTRMYPHAMKPL